MSLSKPIPSEVKDVPEMVILYSSEPFWVYYCATNVEYMCNTPILYRPRNGKYRERNGIRPKYENIRNVYVEKVDELSKLHCLNCKKEVGFMTSEDTVELTNVRSMRIIPAKFRVACLASFKKDKPHGHRFRAEMLLMPTQRRNRLFPNVEHYDMRKRKMEKPCLDLPIMPALFDRNIERSLVKGSILRVIIDNKVNGDVSVTMQKEVDEGKEMDANGLINAQIQALGKSTAVV